MGRFIDFDVVKGVH